MTDYTPGLCVIGRARKDVRGKTFNRLTPMSIHSRGKGGVVWLCKCSCGNTTTAVTRQLASGGKKSCGCLHKTQGGGYGTPEYNSWVGLRKRCYDKSHHRYDSHGRRGIRVCRRWLGPSGFKNFLADMGSKPGRLYSVERKDNDGNYTPDNCVWATPRRQARNRRNNRRVTIDGVTKCLSEWAEHYGIPPRVLNNRLRYWPLMAALTTPAHINLQKEKRCGRKVSA